MQVSVKNLSWYKQEDLPVGDMPEAHQAIELRMWSFHPWTNSLMILCKLSKIRKFQLKNLRKQWRSTKLLAELLTLIFSKQMILSIHVAL